MVKNPPANTGDARSLGQEEPLEREMAARSSILAWKIPRTEELGGPQFTGLKKSDMTERVTTTRNMTRATIFPEAMKLF